MYKERREFGRNEEQQSRRTYNRAKGFALLRTQYSGRKRTSLDSIQQCCEDAQSHIAR